MTSVAGHASAEGYQNGLKSSNCDSKAECYKSLALYGDT